MAVYFTDSKIKQIKSFISQIKELANRDEISKENRELLKEKSEKVLELISKNGLKASNAKAKKTKNNNKIDLKKWLIIISAFITIFLIFGAMPYFKESLPHPANRPATRPANRPASRPAKRPAKRATNRPARPRR